MAGLATGAGGGAVESPRKAPSFLLFLFIHSTPDMSFKNPLGNLDPDDVSVILRAVADVIETVASDE